MTLAPIILPALSSKGARSTLIFLHGLGDSGAGWSQTLHSSLSTSFPSLKILLPNAPSLPLTINGGQKMPQWFDIKAQNSRDKPELQDVEGMEKTRQMLEGLIKTERDEGRKVVLGGFSQGAVMSLFTGLQTSQKLEGLVILSGFLPIFDTIQSKTHPSLPGSSFPVFLAHGTHDRVISFDYAIKTRDFLEWKAEAGGLGLKNVTWKEIRGMGHSSDEGEMMDLKVWMGGVLGWEELSAKGEEGK
ncbi:acyl-protein thioesterase 1 [Mrakia frigida]|uniref:acyl-protein thioesterase 1 n=1 Tax=Mrakia frigida TaxID=29902 RepID=UPI003FCC1910